jgi:hypothetical protein
VLDTLAPAERLAFVLHDTFAVPYRPPCMAASGQVDPPQTPDRLEAVDPGSVLYDNGPLWDWLTERDLIGPAARTPVSALAAFRFRRQGRLRRLPHAGIVRLLADKSRIAPVDRDSAPDPTTAPAGHSLVQAQIPLRPVESSADGLQRLERMLDLGHTGWRGRQTWRRQGLANGRSGALDLPGRTWRDRPQIDCGGGVFLAGDVVAAPDVC